VADLRSTIRQRLGRLMDGDDAIVATPSSEALTTTTFGCAALQVYPDDYFDDYHGRFYSGTHKDTNFTVTNFEKLDANNQKGVVTFAPALSTAVDATDLFELYPGYRPTEMNDAINEAISMVEEEALKDKVDESIVIVASTFEYLIPATLLYIDQVIQESGTAGRYSVSDNLIDIRHWGILRQASPQLWFDNNYVSLTGGRHLRLVGQSVQAQLSLDADLCNINRTFLIYQAKALLHQSRIKGQGADFEEHQSQMTLAQAMADRQRRQIQVAGRGRQVTS
jgi:hypothetical protein